MSRGIHLSLAVAALLHLACPPAPSAADQIEVTGLVLPLTESEFALRTSDSQVRVKWDHKTRVGRKLESWADFRAMRVES